MWPNHELPAGMRASQILIDDLKITNRTFRAGAAMCCKRRILDSIACQWIVLARKTASQLPFPSLHVTSATDFVLPSLASNANMVQVRPNVSNNHNSSYSVNFRGKQRGCRIRVPRLGMLQRLQPIQRKGRDI